MKHLNNSNVSDLVFDGIDHADAPKYVDAYVTSGWYNDGNRELTEDELEYITDHPEDFDLYEKLLEQLR